MRRLFVAAWRKEDRGSTPGWQKEAEKYLPSVLIALLLLGGAVSLFAQTPVKKNESFSDGESLYYKVYWKTFEAGTAVLRTSPEKDFASRLKIVGTAKSSGFVSTLYPVDDRFESVVNVDSFCSLTIMKVTREGGRQRMAKTDFYRDRRVARYEDRNLRDPQESPRRSESAIPICVQDVISAMYYVRLQPLEVGKSLHFAIHDGGKTFPITLEVQAVEEVKTEAGTIRAIRVEPKVFGELFKPPGRLHIWYSDDAARRMVLLKARLNIGTLTASLMPMPNPAASSTTGP